MGCSSNKKREKTKNFANINQNNGNYLIIKAEENCDLNFDYFNHKKEDIFEIYDYFNSLFKLRNDKEYNYGFLIMTQSIPNFIQLIKETKNFENNCYKRNILGKNLIEKIKNYKKENLMIIYDYENCKNILENNNTIKNEFIFVNDEFFNFLNVSINYNQTIILANTKTMQIIFDYKEKKPNKKLSFRIKEKDIYEFIQEEKNIKINANNKIEIKEKKLYSYESSEINKKNLFSYKRFNFSNSSESKNDKNKNPIVKDKYGTKLLKFLDNTRLKLYDNGKIVGLSKNKIGIILWDSEIDKYIFKIYETRSYKIICKLELKVEKILSGIILENNDLILIIREDIYTYHVEIYKLENENYKLSQKIDDFEGYRPKETKGGCLISTLFYQINNIIKLSKNRFMIISSYGFKIYSLIEDNNKIEYSCILLNEDRLYEEIKNIYQLNDNEIIIINYEYIPGGYGGYDYSNCLIDKFNIKENMLENRIFQEKMDYSFRESSFTILKNQYLFVSFDSDIIIIDIQKEIIIKRYKLLCEYPGYIKFYNFKYLEENCFLLYEGGNLYLIEFDIKNYNINIVGYIQERKYKGKWMLSQLKTTNEFVISTDNCFHFLCDNF